MVGDNRKSISLCAAGGRVLFMRVRVSFMRIRMFRTTAEAPKSITDRSKAVLLLWFFNVAC